MRGEKKLDKMLSKLDQGSPPRARGKGRRAPDPRKQVGITPACAGKSLFLSANNEHKGDHPRVRGEKLIVNEIHRYA
mgnify:CR=1 FL=1